MSADGRRVVIRDGMLWREDADGVPEAPPADCEVVSMDVRLDVPEVPIPPQPTRTERSGTFRVSPSDGRASS